MLRQVQLGNILYFVLFLYGIRVPIIYSEVSCIWTNESAPQLHSGWYLAVGAVQTGGDEDGGGQEEEGEDEDGVDDVVLHIVPPRPEGSLGLKQ